MPNKSLVLFWLGGVTLLMGTVKAQVILPPVAITNTPTFSFGMIGLGVASIARLSVVNVVRTPPPILVAIAQIPCKIELDLYDDQGKLIKQKIIANLGFGQADFLDLNRSEDAITGTHVQITGVVKVGSGQSFFCSITPTLEVFDSVTGATTAILASPSTSFGRFFSTGP
jgi:hypothetical protein